MTLLTLNTHSLVEGNEYEKLSLLLDFLLKCAPDVIVLQEVNQTVMAKETSTPEGFTLLSAPEGSIPLREDNFVLSLQRELNNSGIFYHAVWFPIKLGYGRFDEGLAILTRRAPTSVRGFPISRKKDYGNWKTRGAIIAYLPEYGVHICNTHTGRYDDEDEPFSEQWKRLLGAFPASPLILAGDFNSPAERSIEGYDEIIGSGFLDIYTLAKNKTGNATVKGNIDGWSGTDSPQRIDFIFSSFVPSESNLIYRTVLDGINGNTVSDHFGIFAELDAPNTKKHPIKEKK